MTQQTNPQQEPVRLLFEMTRDDNPRLYDDLIRFNVSFRQTCMN